MLAPCLAVFSAAWCTRPPQRPRCLEFFLHVLTFMPPCPARLQRDTVEDVSGYYLGSPTERSLDPLAASAVPDARLAAAAQAPAADIGGGLSGVDTGGDAGGGLPGADLAALLSSPPHTGGHRRTFSRQGSGLSRLISKNWESELPVSACWGLLGGAWCPAGRR